MYPGFADKTYDELVEALNDLNSQGMTAAILDLRGNPGGYLNQAVKIAICLFVVKIK